VTSSARPSPAAAPFVQWLEAPEDPPLLGGKAGPLARALAAGLPVPPGFVISPAAFTDTADSADAQPRPRDPGPLLPGAAEAIIRAYRQLAARLGQVDPWVAVRSSATAEDLAGASFAGQYDTFLRVRGEHDLLTYVARCWASLWSGHAAAYRTHYERRTGTPLPPPRMAVLVQRLADATAAGVVFTADPATGDRSRILINAAWGLGQSLVDGEVEADTWTLERGTLAVLGQGVGHKPTRTGAGPGAPRAPVEERLRRAPCLTPEQAAAVAALALRAEAITGGPADVEWALEGDTLWLLQARPITALPSTAGFPVPPQDAAGAPRTPESVPALVIGPTADFPFEWPSPDAERVAWGLGSFDQRHLEALQPLEQDVRVIWYRSIERTAVVSGRPRYRVPLHVNGYEYVGEIANPRPEADQALCRDALERVGAALAESGQTYRRAVQFPPIDAGNTRLAAVDPDALPPAELTAHLDEVVAWYEHLWTEHWIGPQDSPVGRFIAFFKRHVATAAGPDAPSGRDDARDSEVRELLTHEPNLLTEAIDGLIDLARIAQRHPRLRTRLRAAPAGGFLDALPRTPGGPAFRARLDALLRTQGLRSGAGFGTERNQILPGWAEQPELVVEVVRRYASLDLDALTAARAAAVAARDRRVEALKAQLADEATRDRFDFWLAAARVQQTAFEDHNLKIDSAASALLHRALAAAARRLAAAGVLSTADDVWWLRLHEIALALRSVPAPAAGGGPGDPPAPPHWPALVAARRAHHAWCQRLTPPTSLGSAAPSPSGPVPPPADPVAAPDRAEGAPPNLLVRGSPGSGGVATGRVRLVTHHDLVPDVAAGDVLVARNAGPLWTPIFPVAAAVVLDEGVLFQHAMLTCREYGVPAVFQTKDASKTLEEGQRVIVDGGRGWVLAAG
jgi:pyruvate,water dikinase